MKRPNSTSKYNMSISTQELIKERSQDIFGTIVENKIRRSLYYYRPAEKEFKTSM